MELQFILALLGIASKYLQKLFGPKSVEAKVGGAIGTIDQITLAVLALNAKIKGLTIDWKDPAAVQTFVASLPEFVPIPEPAKPKS